LLAGNDVEAFASAYGEILGDAYTALGRIAEAQDAYQKILMNPASQSTVDQQLVQWKALDLPDVTSLPETSEPEPSETVEQDASDSEEVE
jgi:hypothetical protein